MSRRSRKWLLSMLVVVAFGLMAWVMFLAGRPAPLPPLPNPNGYDNFVKAAEMLSATLEDYREASAEKLRTYVATNSAVLAQLRIGLSRDCRRIAKTLEEISARRESWSDVLRRDVRYTLRAQFRMIFSLDTWRTRGFKNSFYQAERERAAYILDFAACAYQLETGAKPRSETDLVPGYLKAFPKDPLAKTNLVFAP